MGPNELAERHPLLYTGDLHGGVLVEGDGVADPQLVCRTFAQLSAKGGARYVNNCQFRQLITEHGKVCAVETSKGIIQTQFFVNCAGMVSVILHCIFFCLKNK